MGAILNILVLIDGFKTLGGLVISGAGVLVRVLGAEEEGQAIQDFGLVVTGIGATHGGYKKRQGR